MDNLLENKNVDEPKKGKKDKKQQAGNRPDVTEPPKKRVSLSGEMSTMCIVLYRYVSGNANDRDWYTPDDMLNVIHYSMVSLKFIIVCF